MQHDVAWLFLHIDVSGCDIFKKKVKKKTSDKCTVSLQILYKTGPTLPMSYLPLLPNLYPVKFLESVSIGSAVDLAGVGFCHGWWHWLCCFVLFSGLELLGEEIPFICIALLDSVFCTSEYWCSYCRICRPVVIHITFCNLPIKGNILRFPPPYMFQRLYC
jgi:hypothetical protein